MNDLIKDIEVVEIKVAALPGSMIGDCMRESVALAIKEWRNVSLTHNDKIYLIKPNDLISSIKEKP